MQTEKRYDWDIKLDRELQHPVRMLTTKKKVEIRAYVSDLIRKDLQNENSGENQ